MKHRMAYFFSNDMMLLFHYVKYCIENRITCNFIVLHLYHTKHVFLVYSLQSFTSYCINVGIHSSNDSMTYRHISR